MEKINEVLIRYPKASALIPVAAILLAFAYLTSITAVVQAICVAGAIAIIAVFLLALVIGKDIGNNDDWWGPGGPNPA